VFLKVDTRWNETKETFQAISGIEYEMRAGALCLFGVLVECNVRGTRFRIIFSKGGSSGNGKDMHTCKIDRNSENFSTKTARNRRVITLSEPRQKELR
jgi:hypothetical protein